MQDIQGTVHDAFRSAVMQHAQRDFLCVLPDVAARYSMEARTFTYADAAREIDTLQQRYRSKGYGQGHRVGLLLENRPAFFFHWFALNGLGVSVVPVNPDWRSTELEYLLAHSEICAAIVPHERVAALRHAAANAARTLVVTTAELNDLLDAATSAPLTEQAPDVNSECALLYTSGTTGQPKGCILPNEYFMWLGQWYAGIGGLCEVRLGVERLITPLPMSHMNAMACSTMAMLLTGGCIVPLDRFHPASWWQNVRESRATIVHYLGVMPAILQNVPRSSLDRRHSVRFGFGAGVSSSLHAAFENRFGFPLIEGWAMTETGAGAVIIANRAPRKVGTACLGRAEARIEYRLVDERNEDVAAGQAGELLVRCAGPAPRFGFFRDYLKDPAATVEAWQGGYFHTGDIVSVDAEGDFHFIDRKKNVIRRSGENISAVEVEAVLLQHPGIAVVGVTAVPDEIRGDEVMACVVPREPVGDGAGAAREMVEFCLQRLAYFKAPGYLAFCSQLPLTSTAKIQRVQLQELARSLLGAAQCIDTRSMKKRGGT